MELTSRARGLAEQLLATALPRRWKHVQAVAAKAEAASRLLPAAERDLVVAAAWLHDIGYAPDLVRSGFHPLDGARWLRDAGFDIRLAQLVAHHSCAMFEAEERGLAEVLGSEFAAGLSQADDVLWWADMTTGPDGQGFTLHERLAEISSRYGEDHVVSRTWKRAAPVIVDVVGRIERALADSDQPI